MNELKVQGKTTFMATKRHMWVVRWVDRRDGEKTTRLVSTIGMDMGAVAGYIQRHLGFSLDCMNITIRYIGEPYDA